MDTQTRQLAAACPPTTRTTLAHLVSYLNERGDDLPVDEALGMAIDAWLAADKLRAGSGPADGYQWKCLFLPDGTHVRMRCKGRIEYAVVEGDRLLYEGRSVSPRGMTLAITGEGRNAWSALMVRRPGDANWQYASTLRARIERTARQAQAYAQVQAQLQVLPQTQPQLQLQPPSQPQSGPQSQSQSQPQLPPQPQSQSQPQPLPQFLPQPQLPPQPHMQAQAISHADSLATAARCMSDALRSAMAVVDHMNAQAALQQDERRRGRCRRESDRHPDDAAFE